MHKLVLLSPFMLVACATAPAPQPIPIHGETAGHVCRDADTAQFIGQQVSEQTGAAIQQATNAAILRWAAPGMMLTMDFRGDRVTVWYTPDRKITKVHCG
jgi:hypothetical protein